MDVTDPVAAAFNAVPRAVFLPGRSRREVAADRPVDIGHGQTNSQPRTVAAMLRLLDVRAGHHVLDVGSGSGWTTGLLAWLVGPTGRVRGVELVPGLVATGSTNLGRCGFAWASIEQAKPGVLGLPDVAPFDRVLVSAAARALPHELVDQLLDGGIMVVPVDGTMLRVVRDDSTPDGVRVSAHGAYRFVPLR